MTTSTKNKNRGWLALAVTASVLLIGVVTRVLTVGTAGASTAEAPAVPNAPRIGPDVINVAVAETSEDRSVIMNAWQESIKIGKKSCSGLAGS
jgi:hypothetical protein